MKLSMSTHGSIDPWMNGWMDTQKNVQMYVNCVQMHSCTSFSSFGHLRGPQSSNTQWHGHPRKEARDP